MAQFFPGVFYASLAAIPGFAIGALFAASRMWAAPLPELLQSLARGVAYFTIVYGVAALVYGGILWLFLRAVGWLTLPALLIGGLLPVVILLSWSLFAGGYDANWFYALVAFSVPALFVSFALWWFTVAVPARG